MVDLIGGLIGGWMNGWILYFLRTLLYGSGYIYNLYMEYVAGIPPYRVYKIVKTMYVSKTEVLESLHRFYGWMYESIYESIGGSIGGSINKIKKNILKLLKDDINDKDRKCN